MSLSIWKDRKVLITGHTGFKGAWLSLLLEELGAEVVGYALTPEDGPSLFDLADVASSVDSRIGDVRDLDALAGLMTETEPNVILHLAAQSLVRRSYDAPVDTYTSNVIGAVHVLEAARQTASVKAVVNVTSDKCYENREWTWPYRETDRLGGRDPYSNSKACAELVTRAYFESFLSTNGVGVATARAGNVIGGGDWAQDRIIPDAISAFKNAEPLVVRNPKAVRPWQHVLEPLVGYLQLCGRLLEQPLEFSRGFNFGPSMADVQSVACVADMLSACWGDGAVWQHDSAVHPHEAQLLRLDSSEAQVQLDWVQKWHLSEAVDRTVAWYKAWATGENMRDVTIAQIREYLACQTHDQS